MYTFEDGEEGWTGAFTDYSAGMEDGMQLTYEHRALPSGVDREGQALYLAGQNHSDDLFMFAKHRLTGLAPNTMYNVSYHLELASNAPTGVERPAANSV